MTMRAQNSACTDVSAPIITLPASAGGLANNDKTPLRASRIVNGTTANNVSAGLRALNGATANTPKDRL
jgi:hypothetical protein